jgi:hypothetical protein
MTGAPGEAPADRADGEGESDDLVPVSVRLGAVVPPEDPEDWTRPLTWVAALGMLAAPILTIGWFWIAPPDEGLTPTPMTYLVAAALGAGAAATGATQQGMARAWTATIGAGLFGALAVIVAGVIMAGERQVGSASPTLAHAFAAALSGLGGAAAAAPVAGMLARRAARPLRYLAALLMAVAVAVLLVGRLMPATAG